MYLNTFKSAFLSVLQYIHEVEKLKCNLAEQLTISEEDWLTIKNRFMNLSCKKSEILTRQGEIENRLFFINNGIVRLHHETNEKDITVNFAFPESFVSAYTSFLTNQPSEFAIEALTACEFVYITRDDLFKLYAETSCGQALGRIFSERLFLYLSKRENDFMLKSPTERYLALFEEQPHLIQQIPQKYLSSYIGITPQALSRIRAKI